MKKIFKTYDCANYHPIKKKKNFQWWVDKWKPHWKKNRNANENILKFHSLPIMYLQSRYLLDTLLTWDQTLIKVVRYPEMLTCLHLSLFIKLNAEHSSTFTSAHAIWPNSAYYHLHQRTCFLSTRTFVSADY